MATDDPDTNDETEERRGIESERSSKTPGTYANAGREAGTETREQAGSPATGASRGPTDRRQRGGRQSERHQQTRRYGTQGKTEQPSQRYGSRPPSGEQNEELSQSGEPRGESRRDSGNRIWIEKPGRIEQTPPKRTQPLREPTTSQERDREPKEDREQEIDIQENEKYSERKQVGGRESPSKTEPEGQSNVPKYGGPRDSTRENDPGQSVERQGPGQSVERQGPGQSVERQRTQREYERRFDIQQARQRDFQRDKSGGKYRRK